MADPLLQLSLSEASSLIRKREISPVELVERHLAHIEACQPTLNAFITVTRAHAEREAKAAEAAILQGKWRSPLHGLPYSVKDTITTRGVRTTMGSRLFSKYVPDDDALCVARAGAAGAVLVGKTTTPEFGIKCLTDGPLYGRTLNPWAAELSCGGSSGGAAVATATQQGLFALATDGGGSIRIPASCCGVYGLKPTPGVIPHVAASDLFSGAVCSGVMGRSVGDLRIMLEVLAGSHRDDPFCDRSPQDVGNPPGQPLRIGWLPTVGRHEVHPEWRQAGEAAAHRLADAGHQVDEASADLLLYADAAVVLIQSLTALQLAPLIDRQPDRFDPMLVRIANQAKTLTAADVLRANSERSRCYRAVQALFSRYDILLTPTLAGPPPSVDVENAETLIRSWYPYTFPFNLSGHPALTAPVGLSTEGLPIGLQIVAPWRGEARLLAAAACLAAPGG